MKEVVIVSAGRTPVGNFGGSLRSVPAYDLGALVLNRAVKSAELESSLVNMVIQETKEGSYEFCEKAEVFGFPFGNVSFTRT